MADATPASAGSFNQCFHGVPMILIDGVSVQGDQKNDRRDSSPGRPIFTRQVEFFDTGPSAQSVRPPRSKAGQNVMPDGGQPLTF